MHSLINLCFNNNLHYTAAISEHFPVSMALRENTYPFLGLLCMRDTRMVLVSRNGFDSFGFILYVFPIILTLKAWKLQL